MKQMKQNVTTGTSILLQHANQWSLWIYSIAIWLVIVFALRNQRGYQDSWVLEDIVLVIFILGAAFIAVVASTQNSSRLALLSSSFVMVLRWVPGLKYSWAYGTAVDQAVHVTNTQQIIQTGFPPLETVYSNVPGIHILLSAITLVSGATVEEALRYGFPILVSLTPLVIYFFCAQIQIEPALRNQIIIASALVFDPYFLVAQGSPFGALLLAIIIYLFISREYSAANIKLAITPILLSTIIALTFSHSVTAIILMLLLIICNVTLTFLSNRVEDLKLTQKNMIRFLILIIVFCFSWWMYQAEGIFYIFVKEMSIYFSQTVVEKAPVPIRAFQLPLKDLLTILWMLHANVIIMFLLATIGLILTWRYRESIFNQYRLLVVLLFTVELAIGVMLGGQLVRGFGNIEYFRLMGYAIILSPFFVGVTLKYIKQWNSIAWTVALSSILFLSLMQVFPYQPIIPTGDSLDIESLKLSSNLPSQDQPEKLNISSSRSTEIDKNVLERSLRNEPVVYLHSVMTDYQINMLAFTKTHLTSNVPILANSILKNTAYRFWGPDFFAKNQVRSVDQSIPLDSFDNSQIYLLHRAGIAGSLNEQLEYRNWAEINRILSKKGRSLIYNNGEVFVVLQPPKNNEIQSVTK